MAEDQRELAHHVVAYAMLMRASNVITEQQYAGIKKAFDDAVNKELRIFMVVVNKIMAACNQAYEKKLVEMNEYNSLIVRV